MTKAPKPDRAPVRPVVAVRILAFVCLALALMCAGLAWAWRTQREEAACWRTAAEFQLMPEGECRS
jgi:hypothetical protein